MLRAVGESPASAHALGYPVRLIRLAAVVAGGALCGLAGAYISVSYTPLWVEGMVAGKGWIALALTTFATWRPARVLLGAYLFGGVTMLQFHLQGMGVEVYSVSTDTHFSHKAWHDGSPAIGKINFHMLGDQNHFISNNFGVLREGQGLADRATFVVDPDGVIQVMEITCEGVGRNAVELVRKIKAAIYVRENPGQVCPAKWEEGSETLAPSIDLVGKI